MPVNFGFGAGSDVEGSEQEQHGGFDHRWPVARLVGLHGLLAPTSKGLRSGNGHWREGLVFSGSMSMSESAAGCVGRGLLV